MRSDARKRTLPTPAVERLTEAATWDVSDGEPDSLVPMPNREERESGRRLVRRVRALLVAPTEATS